MKNYKQTAAVVALVLIFGGAGVSKLVSASSFQDQFAHFGLPAWLVLLTGIVELTGAALIALSKRRLRQLGAGLLAITMSVATVLHLLHDPVALALPAAALTLLAAYVAFVSRESAIARDLANA